MIGQELSEEDVGEFLFDFGFHGVFGERRGMVVENRWEGGSLYRFENRVFDDLLLADFFQIVGSGC